MITPPTDNLYKFIAIFGLVVFMSSSAFWWSALNKFDEFAESNKDYLYYIYKNSDAYIKFAEKANEGIAIYNSVGGKKELFTKQQKSDFDKLMLEAKELQKHANAIINKDPIKQITINTRLEKYKTAKHLSIAGILVGVLISFFGFYLWHTRLQRFIDKNIQNNILNQIKGVGDK